MNIKKIIKNKLPKPIKGAIINQVHKIRTKVMVKKARMVLPYSRGMYPFGINLICDIKAETGLGQSARIIASILAKSEIPFCIVQVDQPGDLVRDNNDWDDVLEDTPLYCINLIHINASEWARFYSQANKEIFDFRYNIAYWLWELEKFPQKWIPCIQTVDEIWAPSSFICNCLMNYTDKTVRKVSYSITMPDKPVYDRKYFGMRLDTFYYLIMYDFKSVSERKNPKAALDAFINAYSAVEANNHNIGLILKINHLESGEELDVIKKKLSEYENIKFMTSNYTRQEVESLIANVDVLISLHRSEGFGLPVAEAMYCGIPVVSTAWSATSEFTTENNSCPVQYTYSNIEKNIGPYEKGNRWADAIVEDATFHIKALYENKELYKKISANASKSIKEQFDAGKIALEIEKHLEKFR